MRAEPGRVANSFSGSLLEVLGKLVSTPKIVPLAGIW